MAEVTSRGNPLFYAIRSRMRVLLRPGFHTRSLPGEQYVRAALALAIYASIALPLLPADNAKPTEYQVKAAYLSNFGKFVQWPAASGAGENTFNVCVIGQDPFGAALDTAIAGERINKLPLEAKRITAPHEVPQCRIVFIGASEDGQLDTIISTSDKTGVLTVSDIPKFLKRGGMIAFVADGKRVRFEVNLSAAQRAGMNMSSELLKLAVSVQRDQ
jgi:hypothetical protein